MRRADEAMGGDEAMADDERRGGGLTIREVMGDDEAMGDATRFDDSERARRAGLGARACRFVSDVARVRHNPLG